MVQSKFLLLYIIILIAHTNGVFCKTKKGKDSSIVYFASDGSDPFNYPKITDLIFFGDSYSALGTNYTDMTYHGYNRSGDRKKNWTTYLTNLHNKKIWNFAAGGSSVDDKTVNALKGHTYMTLQYKYFLRNMGQGKKFSSWKSQSTLFLVWFGVNDCRFVDIKKDDSNEQMKEKLTAIIASMFNLVNGMYDHGARNFVIVSAPALELTPRYIVRVNSNIKTRVNLYNKAIQEYSELFSSTHPDANLFYYNCYNEFYYIKENMEQYNIIYDNFCPEKKGCKNPTSYYWFDDLHPLYSVHEIIAKDLDELLMENSITNKNNTKDTAIHNLKLNLNDYSDFTLYSLVVILSICFLILLIMNKKFKRFCVKNFLQI